MVLISKSLRHLLLIASSFTALLVFFTGTVSAIPAKIPVPFITGISPVSVLPGGADFALTIHGANFRPCSTMVYWGTTLLTPNSVSASKLTVTVPAALIISGGTGWITVQNTGNAVKSNVVYLPVASPVSSLKFAELDYPADDSPLEVAQGDVNNDGKLDLIVSNYSAATLGVFLGNGDGTFQAQVSYPVSIEPFGLAVGDFNGDGYLDVILGHDYSSQSLDLLLNNGDGTFQAVQSVNVGLNYPLHPSVADMNRDGRLDIIASDWAGNSLAILLGNGDGTFQAPQITTDLPANSWNVAISDFNEDGVLDVAAGANGAQSVSIFLGIGDGTLSAPENVPASSYALFIRAADMNGDGHSDLVVGSQNGVTTILLGNGDGTFQSPLSTTQQSDYAEDVGDFNGDGHLDIVAAGEANTLLYLGNGDGTVQEAQSFANNGFSYGVVAGPFATGGGLGFATTNFNNGKLVVLLQTLSLSPSPVDFGDQAAGSKSGPQVVTVTNSTSNTVNISGISFIGANAGDFAETNTCGSSLASAATCTINLTFTPGAAGARTATLNLSDDAPASPQAVDLSGTGVSAAIAVLSATSLDFAPQLLGSSSVQKTVNLQNTGNIPLALTSIHVTGTDAADFIESDNCGVSVAPSVTCALAVTFTPSAIGSRGAAISITSSASETPATVSLEGTGQDFSLILSGGQTVTAGNSATFQLSITPLGGFNQAVTLSCSGAPALATCTVTPGSATPDGTIATNVSITLATTGKSILPPQFFSPSGRNPVTGLRLQLILLSLALLALFAFAAKPRKLQRVDPARLLLACAVLVALTLGLAACGSKHVPSGGTPAGAYTLTLTATSGSVSHSSTAQLTVQ